MRGFQQRVGNKETNNRLPKLIVFKIINKRSSQNTFHNTHISTQRKNLSVAKRLINSIFGRSLHKQVGNFLGDNYG